MSSAAATVPVFQNPSLQLIWNEIELATQKGEQRGIQFSEGRDAIAMSYESRGSSVGQSRSHSRQLWADLCQAMRFIGRISHHHGWKSLVSLREGYSTNWTIYPAALAQEPPETLRCILQRVDEALALLDAPLDVPTT